jgi:hypothetical protein
MRQLLIALAIVAGCSNNNASTQRQEIGTPCTSDSQCGTGDFFCATLDHPNGYCKKDCATDADCPASPPAQYKSVCAGAGPNHKGECHRVCNQPTDCRVAETYICKMGADAADASHSYCDAPEPAGDGG